MRSFAASLPWFLPGMVLTLIVAALLARPVARRLGDRPLVAFLLLMALGAILWATLPPDDIQLGPAPGFGSCDLRRIGFAPIGDYLRLNDTSLNVILFVPLGLVVGWLWRIRPRWSLLLVGALLPLGIEAWQSTLPILGRGCQSADILDNTVGLAIGVAGGILLGRLVGRSKEPGA